VKTMRIKKERPPLPELKRGSLLVIKTPPFFNKEYLYEITSAGDKLIRASLYHSPTVRRSWTKEALQVHFEHGIVRTANDADIANLSVNSNELKSDSANQPEELEQH
jgi:hypothetical protein